LPKGSTGIDFRPLNTFARALECDEEVRALEPHGCSVHHNRDLVLGEAADLIMWRARRG
jgi:hypothetical protein